MRIHGKVESSTANGPGRRATIWLQGCDLSCSGCWNPETWDPKQGTEIKTPELLNWILSLPNIEGLTLSGGEPMQQPYEVSCLIQDLKGKLPDLSIGMFTGYSQRELEPELKFDAFTRDEARLRSIYWSDIRRCLDFAVMGRFNEHLVQIDKPLVSSSNQRLVLFPQNGYYRYKMEDFERQLIEVLIEPDGTRTITGFPVSKWEYLLDRVD